MQKNDILKTTPRQTRRNHFEVSVLHHSHPNDRYFEPSRNNITTLTAIGTSTMKKPRRTSRLYALKNSPRVCVVCGGGCGVKAYVWLCETMRG